MTRSRHRTGRAYRRRRQYEFLGALIGVLLAGTPVAAASSPMARAAAAEARLQSLAGGAASISYQRATGTASFVRIPGGLPQARAIATSPRARAEAFLDEYADLFGIADARQLRHLSTRSETGGAAHVVYEQTDGGLAVFGSRMIVHLDASARVTAANGVTVANLGVDPTPKISHAAAAQAALDGARADAQGQEASLQADVRRLLVFPQGLLQGVAVQARLAYEVEVTGGPRVRDLFYVDALAGKLLERIAGVHHALSRRVYEGEYDPEEILWNEGDDLPFGDPDVDSILDSTASSYELFSNLSGGDHLSYDGFDHRMDAVHDIGSLTPTVCPNAFWDSVSTNFCTGVTSDDIVAHEWTHAYTEHTGGLIYAYQSGALNESFSDIFGEVVDLRNGTGTDAPDLTRASGVCSEHTRNSIGHELSISMPASIAATYEAGSAEFGAELDGIGVSGDIVLADDGDTSEDGTVDDGCQSFVNAAAVAGKIALVRRGSCLFVEKALHAQAAGAIGMVVVNNQGDATLTMAGDDETITIACLFLGQTDGETIIGELAAGVSGTMRAENVATADTWRWLMGEDSTGFGQAIRDMWSPECLGDPGRVGDPDLYQCGTGDSGGVHSNSGVPNHAFALLVDGGTYNGVTVAAIGMTKAASIYWRAMSLYQNPVTDFPAHADALEQACQDLLGTSVPDLSTGVPSQTIVAADCDALGDALAAVEMREEIPCSFEPLLDPDPPPLCEGSILTGIAEWDFETTPAGTWAFEDQGVFAEYVPRDWQWRGGLPDERAGSAIFAANDDEGDCQAGSNDQSGVVYATTPPVVLPEGSGPPRLVFDHYVATEPTFDGGNLSISVNGGPFQLIDGDDITFNSYNRILAAPASPNRNPLAGQTAFSGVDKNSVSGSWGQSQVELSWFAAPGDTIRIRFAFGTDGCFGVEGWYVDDVRVFSCTEPSDGLDPFVCFRDRMSRDAAPFTPIEDVELFTQLDGNVLAPFYDIPSPSALCEPRALQGETISDEQTHLAGFELDAGLAFPQQALDVEIDTALGRTWVDTKDAAAALLPAAAGADPVVAPDNGSHVLDSYVCYSVRKARHAPRFPKGIVVDLADADGDVVGYAVRKPSRLCVAADRDGAGIKNEGTWGHLLCYKTKRVAGAPLFVPAEGIHTASDFGQQQVDLTREQDICVPATITDLASLGH
ncbi:MAG TPA: M4 family metallopeptidase [Candidatus Binatia bacterium]|nr:M4 family metallopeptidase [Candidatus Binatia bacterium]